MNDSSTLARAMPSVERAIDEDRAAIGVARLKANATSRMPTSIVIGVFSSGSTSQRTCSLSISLCSRIGSSTTLSRNVAPADTYR